MPGDLLLTLSPSRLHLFCFAALALVSLCSMLFAPMPAGLKLAGLLCLLACSYSYYSQCLRTGDRLITALRYVRGEWWLYSQRLGWRTVQLCARRSAMTARFAALTFRDTEASETVLPLRRKYQVLLFPDSCADPDRLRRLRVLLLDLATRREDGVDGFI